MTSERKAKDPGMDGQADQRQPGPWQPPPPCKGPSTRPCSLPSCSPLPPSCKGQPASACLLVVRSLCLSVPAQCASRSLCEQQCGQKESRDGEGGPGGGSRETRDNLGDPLSMPAALAGHMAAMARGCRPSGACWRHGHRVPPLARDVASGVCWAGPSRHMATGAWRLRGCPQRLQSPLVRPTHKAQRKVPHSTLKTQQDESLVSGGDWRGGDWSGEWVLHSERST